MSVFRAGTNKSSINNFPNIRPTLDLDFANTKTLDPRITFTRASGGSYVGADELIKYAGVNEARFDHDPITSESLGLLIEESTTNIILNSGDTSLWGVKANMVPTGNAIVLPDGSISTNVEYRGETTEPNSKFLRPTAGGSMVAGETWCFSVFLRAGTERTVNINLVRSDGTEGIRLNSFNMVTGEISPTVLIGGATNANSGVIKYPNDWWRVWISCTFASTAGFQTIIRLFGFSNQVAQTTSFSSWGAQLEKTSYPTSYIPTQASTRTRAPDNAQITGKNFSDFYNSNEGTLYFNGRYLNRDTFGSATRGFLTINDFTANNRIDFRQNLNNSILSSNGVNVSWVGVASPSIITGLETTSFIKTTMSYSTSSHSMSVGGYVTRRSSTKIAPIFATRLALFMRDGQNTGGPAVGQGGHMKCIKYYPKKLSDNEIANITR
jgi:hypothetical protein